MKTVLISKNNLRQAVIKSLVLLLFLNILYTLFFFSKTYEEASITTSLKSNVPTQIWYVYKNKNSDERIFSDRILLTPNLINEFQYTIDSNKELDYIGLFWVSEKGSSLEIYSYNQKVKNKTYKSNKNREIIDYTSKGSSIINLDSVGVKVSSTNSNRNWIMLNDTGYLNGKRDLKVHKPISLMANILLIIVVFVSIFFYRPIPKCFKFSITKTTDIVTYLCCIWAFLIPFWVISSHTLMGLIVLLTFYVTTKKNQWNIFLNSIKKSRAFFAFFIWVVIATAITSTNKQFYDVLLENSYFIFMPLVFVTISQKALNKIIYSFEIGILTYFLLLSIFTITSFFQIKQQVSFVEFAVTTVEIFWHTSYLSALVLIVFIKHIKQPVSANFVLLVYYIVSLLFMYIVNARLPFVVGALILMYKLSNIFKHKFLRTSFFALSIIAAFFVAGFFLTNKANNVNTIKSIQSLDARLTLWEVSAKQIKHNLIFGVGSKNTVDTIANGLSSNIDTKFRDYNVHNQFLETFLSYGLIGFAIFMTLFFRMYSIKSIYSKAFILTCSALFLVESYLQRQAGIVFFTFWYCFFLIYKPGNYENEH